MAITGGVGHLIVTETLPPVLGDPQTAAQRPLDQRACDSLIDQSTSNHLTERHGQMWDARRLIDDFDRVRASVLMFHGLGDSRVRVGSPHGSQDDWAWQALSRAPKRHIMGQWAHVYPGACDSSLCADGEFPAGWPQPDWKSTAFAWLDYYLKGIGDKPDRLGTVDYQDTAGAWHASKEWPPREARDEVLYLADDKLATAPGGARRSFAAVNSPSTTWAITTVQGVPSPVNPEGTLCPRPSDAAVATGLLYSTPAVTSPTLIAGNPFAYIQLDSTQAGGIMTAGLLDIGPDFACDASGTPSDVRLMTAGVADLQYHAGGFTPKDFPTATASPVRLDFENIVVKLAPGHRVGLILVGPVVHFGEPYAPTIGISSPAAADSSQLVLPIVEGGFGGAKPKTDYPPRPFLPAPKSAEVISLPSTRACASRRNFTIRLRRPAGRAHPLRRGICQRAPGRDPARASRHGPDRTARPAARPLPRARRRPTRRRTRHARDARLQHLRFAHLVPRS